MTISSELKGEWSKLTYCLNQFNLEIVEACGLLRIQFTVTWITNEHKLPRTHISQRTVPLGGEWQRNRDAVTSTAGEALQRVDHELMWSKTRPGNMIHSPNRGLMLGQYHRRWPNIKPTLGDVLCYLRSASSGE